MTKRKNVDQLIGEILPDQIYRVSLSPVLFGYGAQTTRDKIKRGELPRPFPLSVSARFEAWTGKQILEHRARMQALAARQLEGLRGAERKPKPRAT
jgi:hypothetical protein